MVRRIDLSASMLRAYKQCPRSYELKYIEGLTPIKSAEYLETGLDYHKCVEHILKREPYEAEGIVADMAYGFAKYVSWQDWDVTEVEYKFRVKLTPYLHMIGIIDALCSDGTPVEHKTTGASISDKYVDHLRFDDQVSFYLLALSLLNNKPVTRMIYTVCPKTTIKLNKNETEEAFAARRRAWYSEPRIQVFTATRAAGELAEIESDVRAMASEMRRRKFFFRNPSNCTNIRCSFDSICLNYDPEITIGFEKKERLTCNF